MAFSDRRGLILKAVVEEYVRSGQPVGSGAIVRRSALGVSPATVRNELARLEETGYVTQPHTSAGRTPSDLGYRFYVDHLMSTPSLMSGETHLIRTYLRAHGREVRDAVRAIARLLADITSYIVVVMAPDPIPGRLQRVHLLPLTAFQVLLVVLLDSGVVQHKLIDLPEALPRADLAYLSAELDDALTGCTAEDLPGMVAELLKSSLARYGNALARATQALLDAFPLGAHDGERIYLGGTANLLRLPEFQDIERLRRVLGLLEQDAQLFGILEQRTAPEGVRVTIGREHPAQAIQDCALVTMTYRGPGGGTGLLGLLGPTRMDYGRVTALLGLVRHSLDELLGE
ncbi:MAG: heat-inducible transcriptional repressor HrcA [Bacillota bacterium]|nr:heat-inducible transcriptional repressor HrcA [Bacillota bacterium]